MTIAVLLAGMLAHPAGAQNASQENLSKQIQQLTNAMARTQAQLQESQHQLDVMRSQLNELKRNLAQNAPASASSADSGRVQDAQAKPERAAVIQEIRERQAMQETQIAVHDQTKVESESRYPVKITGLVLLNAFANTGAVDIPATPTLAIPGTGSTGASVRQTILGIDARGPHLFGAKSFANLRVDFNGRSGASSTAGYSGYYGANSMLLRFRTARAALQWSRTEAFFSLDRPIFSPDMPDSLTAVAEPPLAWSGNLWTWNPQLGVTQGFSPAGSRGLRLQAALIDTGDAPLSPGLNLTTAAVPPSGAERSRWPGVEARVAILGSERDLERNHFGIGGYFASHNSTLGYSFDSWAGTLDGSMLLPAGLQLTGSFYRGLALGGLGGGAYKDFAYRYDEDSGAYYFQPLDDVGGWAQLKEKMNERLQFNEAFGMDNVFASELRPYYDPGASMAQNLARNRTYTGNVIYSPSAYLLFSLEYRHLESSPVIGPSAERNIVGLGAGYKF